MIVLSKCLSSVPPLDWWREILFWNLVGSRLPRWTWMREGVYVDHPCESKDNYRFCRMRRAYSMGYWFKPGSSYRGGYLGTVDIFECEYCGKEYIDEEGNYY